MDTHDVISAFLDDEPFDPADLATARRMVMRVIARTAVMLALGSTAAMAQTDSAATGWSPTLVVRAVPSRPEGTRSPQVSGERKLVPGEPATVTIWSGRSLCVLGMGEPLDASCQVHTVTLEATLVMQAADPELYRDRSRCGHGPMETSSSISM